MLMTEINSDDLAVHASRSSLTGPIDGHPTPTGELPPSLYSIAARNRLIVRSISKIISSYLDIETKTVLDFGCGVGSLATIFPPANYLGVDADARRIEYARSHKGGYTFGLVTGEELDVPPQSIDTILVIGTLHHMPDSVVKACFVEFHRVLTPSGQVVALEPFIGTGAGAISRLTSALDRGSYIRTIEEYVALFGSTGFMLTVPHVVRVIAARRVLVSARLSESYQ